MTIHLAHPTSHALYFATQNKHKLHEAQEILQGYRLVGLQGLHEAPLREPYATLKENAAAKATYIAKRYGVDCFAEDTGLFVDALQGRPGVHTARYAGPMATDAANCQKLLLALQGVATRTAYFHSIIALCHKGHLHFFEGRCEGRMSTQLQGKVGFGYDPVFLPTGSSCSFAQMTRAEKHSYSHRNKALQALSKALARSS